MGIYSDVIRKRDENNRLLEHSADRSLLEDMNIYRLEDAVEDAQTAALSASEQHGHTSLLSHHGKSTLL